MDSKVYPADIQLHKSIIFLNIYLAKSLFDSPEKQVVF